ncbi:MAG: hypothetical protein V7K57_26260 [Nostoc sp.]
MEPVTLTAVATAMICDRLNSAVRVLRAIAPLKLIKLYQERSLFLRESC